MIERLRRSVLAITTLAVAAALAPGALAQGGYRAPPGEPKYTAIVMDAGTGEILYSERADSLRYPASVTKVMTLYLAFEALAAGRVHLDDTIVVSPLAAAQPATKLGLRAGETISLRDAMYAMAVHSANDMAVAVAEKIGGTSSRFADMMTLKAQQLGMTNTRYVNPNGLPDNRQISSAHDIAILTRSILRDFPQYYSFFSQQTYTYRGRTYANTNHLLGKMPGVDGLKTGFTNAAGFNLDASAARNGHRLIAVVMGSSSGSVRNANVEGLLLTGFDIEDRRDHGEKIASTQAFFEHTPYGAGAVRYAQAEKPADPIELILNRTPPHPMPLAAAAANASLTAKTYWVQVGEFRSRQAARLRIEVVSRRFASLFDSAEGTVDGARRAYVARFRGLDQTAAHEACSAVRSHGLPCVIGARRV
jgi:D-alanyl-D-alanine carboxypeptidase (penicillin-binding protein 5/6)